MASPKAAPKRARSAACAAADAHGPERFLSWLYLPIGPSTFLSGDPANTEWLRAEYGAAIHVVACSPPVVLAAIERKFRAVFTVWASRELAEREPQFSASVVITRGQIAVFAAIAVLIVLMQFIAPQQTDVVLTAALGIIFFANGAFRALLLWVGGRPLTPASSPPDAVLPIYSILVPLYREAKVIPSLARALLCVA